MFVSVVGFSGTLEQVLCVKDEVYKHGHTLVPLSTEFVDAFSVGTTPSLGATELLIVLCPPRQLCTLIKGYLIQEALKKNITVRTFQEGIICTKTIERTLTVHATFEELIGCLSPTFTEPPKMTIFLAAPSMYLERIAAMRRAFEFNGHTVLPVEHDPLGNEGNDTQRAEENIFNLQRADIVVAVVTDIISKLDHTACVWTAIGIALGAKKRILYLPDGLLPNGAVNCIRNDYLYCDSIEVFTDVRELVAAVGSTLNDSEDEGSTLNSSESEDEG